MADNSNSRARVLAGIRMSLGDTSAPPAIAAEYASIPRSYTRTGIASAEMRVELFIDRLLEYDAGFYRSGRNAIAETIAKTLSLRARRRLAIPAGLPQEWLPDGFEFAVADNWSNNQLDNVEGTLSACTVAIAETGTIVLQNTSGQGPRSLSLVPDYFLCVVFAEQIVATVPEAFARIEATSTLPTTFISGPSATADIEMTRIKGVHGPRFLDVILVA